MQVSGQIQLLVLIVIHMLLPNAALGTYVESTYAGDRDVRYMNCLVPCQFECHHPEFSSCDLAATPHVQQKLQYRVPGGHFDLFPVGKAAYHETLWEALMSARVHLASVPGRSSNLSCIRAVSQADLPAMLRLAHWDCSENCKYECMHDNSVLRKRNGEQQVHYHGKWPFVRVFGIQELLSSMFSLLNGLPYLLLLLQDWRHRGWIHARPVLCWSIRIYCLLSVNTWLQSALFHARECPATEALDYFCANMNVAKGLGFVLLQHIPRHWSAKTTVLLAYMLPILSWVSVVCYLSFVEFDYGLFMTFTVSLGICASLLWLLWVLRFRATFSWKILVPSLGVYVVLPLELLDFPPMLGLADAHAMWHLCTVPLQFVVVDFYRELLSAEASPTGVKKMK